MDGWSNPKSNSIYNFIIMTSDRKEYLHSLKDFSAESHTADFLANKIKEVIEEIGEKKFAAIVSDNASAIAAARQKISESYPHIMNIHYIVNLISKDILGKYK